MNGFTLRAMKANRAYKGFFKLNFKFKKKKS